MLKRLFGDHLKPEVKKTALTPQQIADAEAAAALEVITQKFLQLEGATLLTAENAQTAQQRNDAAINMSVNGLPVEEDPGLLKLVNHGRNDTRERDLTASEVVDNLRYLTHDDKKKE